MDLYEKTIEFITENKADSYFTRGISEKEIINIEKELSNYNFLIVINGF